MFTQKFASLILCLLSKITLLFLVSFWSLTRLHCYIIFLCSELSWAGGEVLLPIREIQHWTSSWWCCHGLFSFIIISVLFFSCITLSINLIICSFFLNKNYLVLSNRKIHSWGPLVQLSSTYQRHQRRQPNHPHRLLTHYLGLGRKRRYHTSSVHLKRDRLGSSLLALWASLLSLSWLSWLGYLLSGFPLN